MYYPIKMNIPDYYIDPDELIIERSELYLEEIYSLAEFDEAGKFKNFLASAADKAKKVGEWVQRALEYLRTSIARLVNAYRASRLQKKFEETLAREGQAVVFDDIPGDEYQSLFEASDMSMLLYGAEKTKEFALEVVKHRKFVIKHACRFIPGVKPAQAAVALTKTITVLVPIILDFISTTKEIAMLQKKYEGKMRKIRNEDGTIRAEFPAEEWIKFDKYRQLTNRLLDIIATSGENKNKEIEIKVDSTEDLINFARGIFPSIMDTIENEAYKMDDKIKEVEAAYDDLMSFMPDIDPKEQQALVKTRQMQRYSAVKNVKRTSLLEYIQAILMMLTESICSLLTIYDNKQGVKYTINGKDLIVETMNICTALINPVIGITDEITEMEQKGELCLDAAGIIIDRCGPHLKEGIKNVMALDTPESKKRLEELRKTAMVKKESGEYMEGTIIDQYYAEAVFSGGKEKVKPLLDMIQKIKDHLDEEIKTHEETTKANKKDKGTKVKPFDPKAFWKNTMFKDFEDELRKIFGFRNVEIHPLIERYISSEKVFESRDLNCAIYYADRFPVEGLVTDSGFYDKSHSLTMEIYVTLGLLKNLTAEEVLAVLLHEFGHSIDPAIIDIKYTQTNILSKYITDRKGAINKDEQRVITKTKSKILPELALLGGVSVIILLYALAKKAISAITNLFTPKEVKVNKKLAKIKEAINNDKSQFNRQNYSEAFADNFARMYGYGHVLANAIRKMSRDYDKRLRSRYKKEEARQEAIYELTIDMIRDVHKTDIHRIRSLIKEYKADINDPNTPKVVKKQLEEDLLELEKVLDQYLNHKDEFQKRVNNLINDELKKLEDEDEKKEASKKDKEEKPKDDKDKK